MSSRDASASSPDRTDTELADGAFDVVVLAGSAGAMAATMTVLRTLGPDFPLPVVVMLHLSPTSDLVSCYRYQSFVPRTVGWVDSGSSLAARHLLVCPPKSYVELLPDGSFLLSPCERGAMDKPIDRLLDSVAHSFRHRAISVILTGMGADGAIGARALHVAGGRVLVQSPATAEHAGMPLAAIGAGAADLVVPLEDLGQVIGELLAGTPRPKARSEMQAIARAFGDRGAVAQLAREIDWATTPLGPALAWDEEMKTLLRTVMDSPYAMAVWWGPELIQLYNDAWRQFLGITKHPRALGGPARETWAEVWHAIGPMAQRVLERGEAVGGEDYLILIDRHGYLEEVYVTFSYSPIRNAAGEVVGVHNTGWETTRNVLAERRMRALRSVATRAAGAATAREVCERAAGALVAHAADVPFALFYLLGDTSQQATLAALAGLEAGASVAPHMVNLSAIDVAGWPLAQLWSDAAPPSGTLVVDDLSRRFPGLAPPAASPAGMQAPQHAVILPLRATASQRPLGAVVLALSPHRPFDEGYRSFVDFIAQQVSASLAEARARQLERERLERLAQLDRAKTEFFSNVSHEFRTPLTLLLGPLEHFLSERENLPAGFAAEVELAVRNARRLLRLVNNLLDFSEIEARSQRAVVEPTRLGVLTADIASAFRSAIETAGLRMRVEIDADLPLVTVNREMWEKVVSNLLSNAFKFTFDGEIAITLRALRMHAQLEVSDTGVGIPKDELANIFKRFHRVRGAKARTVEGSGIGLAIVQDLVQRMCGQIVVRSIEGRGTTFAVWLPLKPGRFAQPDDIRRPNGRPELADDLAAEAARWITDAGDRTPSDVIEDVLGPLSALPPSRQRQRILIADDNADIRDYLRRLLRARWDVELAADGVRALQAARATPPAAILADVTMPAMDGFELLREVRIDPRLKHTPVILLTARAGESAAIEGLLAGADDYVAKPFSPRELAARIAAAVERAHGEAALRESEQKYRALFDSMAEGYAVVEAVRDETGRPIDARVLESNRAFERLCGMACEQLVGRRLGEVFSSADIERWLPIFMPAVGTGAPGSFEHYVEASDRWHEGSAYARGDDRVSLFYRDVTDRKRSEAALRQTFLLTLSDALRPLTDEGQAQGEACRVLGDRLGVDRVHYAEVDGTDYVIRREYHRPGLAGTAGRYRIDGLRRQDREAFATGRIVAIADILAEPGLTPDEASAYAALGARAFVSVPRVEAGRLVAVLCVIRACPGPWRPDAIVLIEETAERTWTTIDRARAETELQARNDELERFNRVTVGRELRMIELKRQVNALRERLGEGPPYPLRFDDADGG
jgi:PAS domain S-box-containing protein